MKFKIIALAILIQFITSDGWSQKVTYSNQELDAYAYDYIKTAGYNDSSFFVFQSNLPFDNERDRVGFKSRKYKITCFNNNLTIKWSKKIEPLNETEKLETISIINGQVALVKSYFSEKENKLNIQISRLDENGVELKNPQPAGSILFSKGSNLDKIKVIASSDNQLYAILQNEKLQNGQQRLHGIIVKTDYTIFRQFAIDISYPEKNFNYENWLLSDRGDFILEASYYSKEDNEKRKRWDAYKLFVSSYNGNMAQEYAINTSNVELNGSAIAYDKINQKLVLAGFYTDKAIGKSGIVYATLKLNGTDSLHIIRQPISESTLSRMLAGQNLDRSYAGIENLNIEKLILRNDGGVVMVSEISYVTDYSYFDYFTQNYIRNYEYHFNNVIALSVNADGTIDWDAVLRKNQVSTNDYGKYASFSLAQTDSDISLIYNTRADRNNAVSYFSIQNNGQSDSKEIIKPEDRILIIPFAAKQISADELVVPCWNRKKMLMAKFTF
jgi:hypothetical protein